MTRKKIVLLTIIAFLSVILALQMLFGRQSAYRVESLALDQQPDRIEILRPGEEPLVLFRRDGNWLLGESTAFPADKDRVNALVGKISSVRIIDVVSGRDLHERFDLDAENRIRVQAFSDGQRVRTLDIGKASATGRQSYLLLNDENRVLLVSGNYSNDFDRGIEDLRDRLIFSTETNGISHLALAGTIPEGPDREERTVQAFTLSRDPATGSWQAEGRSVPEPAAIDQQKLTNYLNAFSAVRAADFRVSETFKSIEALFTVEIADLSGTFTLRVFGKDQDGFYVCRASSSPYFFRLSAFHAERLMRDLEDFLS